MKKRVISLIIALLLVFSSVAVSAQVTELQAQSADAAERNVLYFEPDTAGWEDYERVYCHIWTYKTGEQFFSWQSKSEACVKKDGKWYYDLDANGISLKKGVAYVCVFSNENGQQTYDLVFSTAVIGDSAYCNGTVYSSPDDSDKKISYAFWRNHDKNTFGPVMRITGWGTVIGTCIPGTKTKLDLFSDFLTSEDFATARIISGKNDQELLDYIGRQMGLKATDIKRAINSTGVDVEWEFEASELYRIGWDDPDILTVDEAVAEYEILNETEVETNRYYFLMPNGKNGDVGDDDSVDYEGYPVGNYGEYSDSWFVFSESGKQMTSTACIYWWDSGVVDPSKWVGYLPSGKDADDPYVFYADIPKSVETIIWNNGVDKGMDHEEEIYYLGRQSVNIPCGYYDAGESPNYPDGTDSFDNMIFVLDPDLVSTWESVSYGGEWYYYYGKGCYGFTKDGTQADCLRHDHHDADGNHVGAGISVDENPSLGDVDGDYKVSVMDATYIQRYVAQIDVFDDRRLKAADMDKDYEVNVMDATEIQRYLAGYRN